MSFSEKSRVVKKKKRWGRVVEYNRIVRDYTISDEQLDEINQDCARSRIVTPQTIAQKHNIRVSRAKEIISDLVEAGKLFTYFKGPHTVIYTNKEQE
ncbi:MAG: hypothetical protein ACTSYA_06830 [Candidatus Kariarchaeaceae archaeon]